jgi:hypothetical protein
VQSACYCSECDEQPAYGISCYYLPAQLQLYVQQAALYDIVFHRGKCKIKPGCGQAVIQNLVPLTFLLNNLVILQHEFGSF